MSTAVSSWTCPQCRRRVPGRAPLCHCGFARAAVSSSSPLASSPSTRPTIPDSDTPGSASWLPVLAALAAVCVVAALALSAARPGTTRAAVSPYAGPRMRGPVGYPPLPAVATLRTRHDRHGAPAALPAGLVPIALPSLRPATPAEQDWGKATSLLDLPLRKIAADTSVLEVRYRPFAGACVDGPSGAAGGEWLGSLRRAALRPGVTLRDGGETVDCETARSHLLARCDALKAELTAAAKLADANHVLPEHWRTLLATYDLSGWEKY
jgi:hypothetical protein